MTSARMAPTAALICLSLAGFSPAEAADHLLVSEVVVYPTAAEYAEIFNPTAVDIDLSDTYLTDATYAGGGQLY